MPDWSQLTDDILLLIFKKLRNLSDCVKFRWVCRPWRSSTLTKGNRPVGLFPGILVSISDRDRSPKHRFLPFSHASLYAEYPRMQNRLPPLSLPAAIFAPLWREHDTLVIGSNEGWLVVVEPPSSIHLTNPVTGAIVSLPSIKSIPGWSEGPFKDERRFFGSIKPWKAVLSGSPNTCNEASPCYVVILFRTWRKIPFCKIGDTAWNCVDIPHNYKEGETEHIIWLSDAIYCKGLFYIVIREDQKLYAFNFRCSVPKLSEIVGFLPQKLQDWTKVDYHLAELEGQLLLIFRGMFHFNYWKNYQGVMKTFKFEVYKLDMQHKNWVVTKSLGQYALFVGRHQSFNASGLDGIKANHIYYLHPHPQGCPVLEIFCLENSTIEPFDFHLLHRRRRSFWFTPVPWDPKEKDPKRRPYVKPRIAQEPVVMPMHPRITISNKFCALIDNDDDQSNDNNRDDSSALSVTIAEMESEIHLNEEINDLSLNAAIRVDGQEVGDSSSDEGPAQKEPVLMPMRQGITISNKFCALIDNDDDQSVENNRDDSSALSVTIVEMASESHLNKETSDLSLNAAIRVDRQEVGDSSSDEGSASMENQTTITEAKEFHRDSNFKLEMRLENTGDEVIHKHRVTSAAHDQSNGTEDFQPAISKKKNGKKSKKNKKK